MKNTVKNVADYAWDYKYWVVTECDDEFWFYGAYNDKNEANEVALNLGKVVISD